MREELPRIIIKIGCTLALCACSPKIAPPASPSPTLSTKLTEESPTILGGERLSPTLTTIATITVPPLPSPIPTATLDLASFRDRWALVENLAKGVSFEYPAIYDEPSWNTACKPHWDSQWYASFGGQLSYEITDADTREFATYLAQYIRYLQVTYPDFKLLSQNQSIQNELDKVVLEYDTNESDIHMIITFFMIDHYAHSFHYTGDYAGCEIPEFGLTTRNVYDHAVETFRLIR